jgi:hypothetical protein
LVGCPRSCDSLSDCRAQKVANPIDLRVDLRLGRTFCGMIQELTSFRIGSSYKQFGEAQLCHGSIILSSQRQVESSAQMFFSLTGPPAGCGDKARSHLEVRLRLTLKTLGMRN